MKTTIIRSICSSILLSLFFMLPAQEPVTVTFKVGQLRHVRKAYRGYARGKGVISSEWDMQTKMLELVYDPAKTTPDAVKKRIAAVGHDTEGYRAKDSIYKGLHKCCKYQRAPE